MTDRIKDEAKNLADKNEEAFEFANLREVRKQLIELSELYTDHRAMSELTHLSAKLLYLLIPSPCSISIFRTLTQEMLTRTTHEKTEMAYIHDMVRQRLMEMGMRVIFARSYRIILGYNERVANMPKSMRLEKRNQSKSNEQILHEFLKMIPKEIISNVKKGKPNFQITELLKPYIQQDTTESARLNPTDFRVENQSTSTNESEGPKNKSLQVLEF